jgi:hypothetical protein
VLAVEEINRRFDFQAGFANKFSGCVSRLSGSTWTATAGLFDALDNSASNLLFSALEIIQGAALARDLP